ncbi:MAG: indole-3-glycerol phosphate synthase TrpC [Firmicutes bacterium]|nr:indole-3-glycerol phosphate synthase TrpC [Bacillota bacterium]
MILQQIIGHKKQELAQEMQQFPLSKMMELATASPPPKDFVGAIRSPGKVNIIAEVKRRSPSKGLLCPNFNHLTLAKAYVDAGAAAISVLTDENFFGGHNRFLTDIREEICLPLLRKDFIIHPYQIYQTKVLGADAVLLIVSALDERTLSELYQIAKNIGLAVLVEVHSKSEVLTALEIGVDLIGINNRNLHTFETDITTTFKLRRLINPEITVVSESGIKDSSHMAGLARHNINAVLIGETLVTASNPSVKLTRLLVGGEYNEQP